MDMRVVSPREGHTSTEGHTGQNVEGVAGITRRCRLRLHGHVMCYAARVVPNE